ncbi:MAG: slipin family protein [Thermoguttaceae bacterium]|nr:slipin family protein [Thermoguttaceae bacterium]
MSSIPRTLSKVRDFGNTNGHVSLGKSLRTLLGGVPLGIGVALFAWSSRQHVEPPVSWVVTGGVLLVLWIIFVSGIRLAAQWERGIVLRLGKFQRVSMPGVTYVAPFIDSIQFVDLRLRTHNIPKQQVITKDNVPAAVDGVLYFKVSDPEAVVLTIQDYAFAISQYAQSTLRDVVGGLSLDELLAERQEIQERIREVVEERVQSWGLHLDTIRLQDIEMPEDLKRIMSRQASAEREKRANITKSEGDKAAAANLAEAARIMAHSDGAMKLRTLQTIDGLGAGQSNTVVMFPMELETIAKKFASAASHAEPDTPESLPQ